MLVKPEFLQQLKGLFQDLIVAAFCSGLHLEEIAQPLDLIQAKDKIGQSVASTKLANPTHLDKAQ